MGNAADIDAILGENVDSAIIHITGESTKSPFLLQKRGWMVCTKVIRANDRDFNKKIKPYTITNYRV